MMDFIITFDDHSKCRGLYSAEIQFVMVSARKQSGTIHSNQPICLCSCISGMKKGIISRKRLHFIKSRLNCTFFQRRYPEPFYRLFAFCHLIYIAENTFSLTVSIGGTDDFCNLRTVHKVFQYIELCFCTLCDLKQPLFRNHRQL